MAYLVLARKWRPQTFSDVVGQGHVTQTLANAIEKDRVAHAFVFSGVRGVGKTSLARILAKSLNCAEGPTTQPCGICDSCKAVTSGTAVDVIEIDGASNNSVEDIRELRETVPYRPQLGRFKIYVIDEVHMLSVSAFNALLKTLEEPPPHVKFIFATTEPHKIPVTILSRCQRYDFRRIPTSAIVGRIRTILKSEEIEADEAALALIGREAEGSMRDALSVLDQVLAAGAEKIEGDAVSELLGIVDRQVYYDISGALIGKKPKRCIEIVRSVDDQGYDMPTFSRGLLEHLRNLVVAGVCGADRDLLNLPDDEIAELVEQGKGVSADSLHRIFKHYAECHESIARTAHPRIILETSLARLADLGDLVPVEELMYRLEALARSGPPVPSAPPGSTGPGSTGPGSTGSSSTGPGSTGSVPVSSAPMGRVPSNSGSSPNRAMSSDQPPVQSSSPAPPRSPTQSAEAPPSSFAPSSGTTALTRSERELSPVQVESEVNAENARKPLPNSEEWRGVIRQLQQASPSLASILECGVPHTDEAQQCVVIRFAHEYAAVASLAKDRGDDIRRGLGKILGREVKVDVAVDEGVEVPVVARRRIEREDEARRLEEEARHHPLVRKVVAEFGGNITRIRMETRGSGADGR